MLRISKTAGLLAGAAFAYGQTYTSCNPLTASCPAVPGFPSSTAYEWDFTTMSKLPPEWVFTAGGATFNGSGACLTINKQGDAPTIQTTMDFFFGRFEVHMSASWGTGIVSSIVAESADLDEIDWEALGGSGGSIETNYFGKGNTSTYDRALYYNVSNIFESHNYTVGWSEQAVQWYIDGTLVRTLAYADAVAGKNFPQTPMSLRIGIWAGGDPGNGQGTIQWAGGVTTYDQPYTMMVQKVVILNANPACSYAWSDQSGDASGITMKTTGCSNSTGPSPSMSSSSRPSSSMSSPPKSTSSKSSPSKSASSKAPGHPTASLNSLGPSMSASATLGLPSSLASGASVSSWVLMAAVGLSGVLMAL